MFEWMLAIKDKILLVRPVAFVLERLISLYRFLFQAKKPQAGARGGDGGKADVFFSDGEAKGGKGGKGGGKFGVGGKGGDARVVGGRGKATGGAGGDSGS